MQASRQEETEAEAARHPRPTHVELLRQELRESEAEIERLRAIVGHNDGLTTVIEAGEPPEKWLSISRDGTALSAAWYESRVAQSVRKYEESGSEHTHIGELRAITGGLIRQLKQKEGP